MGVNWSALTKLRRKGDPVIEYASQGRAIFCIHVPISEMHMLPQ